MIFNRKRSEEKPIITTTTEEIYLPVRIVYKIKNNALFKKRINRLQCIDYDKGGKRWTWLYEGEAKELNFSKQYKKTSLQPMVLASCYLAKQSRFHVYVRSLERLGWAIEFFDKHFKTDVLEGEFLDQYLVLTRADEEMLSTGKIPSPEDIFHGKNKLLEEDYKKRQAMLELLENGDPQSYMQSAEKDMNREINDFKRNNLEMFYEDGLEHYKNTLKMNLMIAYKRDETGKKGSMKDVIEGHIPE